MKKYVGNTKKYVESFLKNRPRDLKISFIASSFDKIKYELAIKPISQSFLSKIISMSRKVEDLIKKNTRS